MTHPLAEQTLGEPVVCLEHLRETLGIGTARPRLSWTLTSAPQGWAQSGYEIELNSSGSVRVESNQSVLVDWPFDPLTSRQRVSVRARVWGQDGQVSAWSQPLWIEAGLLHASDWSARFITPDWDEDPNQLEPDPLLRHEFNLAGAVKQARLYCTALGVYEVYLNGAQVGDHVMAPGWTSYHHRLRYQVFDVTALLRPGRNALGAMLGDGWFRGGFGFAGARRNIYGDRLALLAQLEVEYEDGSRQVIASGPGWRAFRGPVVMSDIYNGETYDARLEQLGWNAPGFDDSSWVGVRLVDWDLATLFAPLGPPVRRLMEIAPVSVFRSPSGKTLVDFGQNLVGRLRLTVEGPAGSVITLRHAEVLEGGELCTRPLRHARATDRYILRGGGPETFEPRFTFHGFRYAEIEGWPGDLRPQDLTAVVCYSDMERTGWFECSDPLINRLHENAVWSMRGNFFDIPTDCPQRDERLGWTGDIQVFSPTASFLFDSSGFLASWLADLAAEQRDYGGVVPFVVPSGMIGKTPPAAAWGDAAVVIPWVLYQRFGDRQILADQFDSMCAWVDGIEAIAGESHVWDKGFQFGDWLDPAAPPDKPGDARTPSAIVATAYFARSAELTGLAAGVLGQKAAQERYLGLARRVREAFSREYITPAGLLLSDSATAYALALQFALLPGEEQRLNAGKRLAALVRANAYHVSTGFVGTVLVCDALCSVGEVRAAYRLLIQHDCPSWLYPVTMGATTIWERWDSMLPDGSVNPGEMTSFNHYALGAVADWLHRTVAGLAPADPGYRRLQIRPLPGGGLTRASASHFTPYGLASCGWKIENGQITLDVVVPPNTSASITLPGSLQPVFEVGSGVHTWTYPFEDPARPRPPLTIDSTFGELVENMAAYTQVANHMRRYGAILPEQVMCQDNLTLRQALQMMPNFEAEREMVEAILAQYGG